MQTATLTSSFTVGGIAFSSTITRQSEGQISHIIDLPAGQAGTLFSTGAATLASGHGFAPSDIIDLHWTDPSDASHKCRRGITIDGTTTTSITFNEDPAAEGDTLPGTGTALVASEQQVIDTDWDGDNVKMIACKADEAAIADFRAAAASLLAKKLVADEAWSWLSDQGVDNPLTGDPVSSIVVSNGSTDTSTFRIGLLYDSA